MGLPRKLKNFNLFNAGQSYMGQVTEVTLPTLSRKMEDYQAGGMSGPVPVDFGSEAVELQWKAGGLLIDALKQYGITRHDGVQLRFAGAYQSSDSDQADSVEIIVRGRHKEINFGSAKVGDDTEHDYTTVCSYYKLTINDESIIELDFVNGIEIVGGDDRTANIRSAIGL